MYYGQKSWLEIIMGTITLMCVGFIGWFLLSMIFAVFATWLWNWIVPVIFGLPEIGYLQMFGLMLLIKLMIPRINIKNNKKDD